MYSLLNFGVKNDSIFKLGNSASNMYVVLELVIENVKVIFSDTVPKKKVLISYISRYSHAVSI